jgi:hypothetical protein
MAIFQAHLVGAICRFCVFSSLELNAHLLIGMASRWTRKGGTLPANDHTEQVLLL